MKTLKVLEGTVPHLICLWVHERRVTTTPFTVKFCWKCLKKTYPHADIKLATVATAFSANKAVKSMVTLPNKRGLEFHYKKMKNAEMPIVSPTAKGMPITEEEITKLLKEEDKTEPNEPKTKEPTVEKTIDAFLKLIRDALIKIIKNEG